MDSSGLLPPPVERAVNAWLGIHDRVAPGLVNGLYVVGSAALDDWQPTSDIDIMAFAATAPTEADADGWRTAHNEAVRELGDVKIDGPRLQWGDVAKAPKPLVRPWTLDGVFHHDGDCFELNPVMWFTLAAYGVPVRGPAPKELTINVDVADRRAFVQANTATYWRSVATAITEALEDPDRETFNADMTAWSVLGSARMLYTARTRDVMSKSAAGVWVIGVLPEYRALVEHAIAVRESPTTAHDSREVAAETAEFLDEVVRLVEAAGESTI